jgi:hypothetical protein
MFPPHPFTSEAMSLRQYAYAEGCSAQITGTFRAKWGKGVVAVGLTANPARQIRRTGLSFAGPEHLSSVFPHPLTQPGRGAILTIPNTIRVQCKVRRSVRPLPPLAPEGFRTASLGRRQSPQHHMHMRKMRRLDSMQNGRRSNLTPPPHISLFSMVSPLGIGDATRHIKLIYIRRPR